MKSSSSSVEASNMLRIVQAAFGHCVNREEAIEFERVHGPTLQMLIRRHAVTSHFLNGCQTLYSTDIPPDLICSLHRRYRQNAARNLFLAAELTHLMDLLQRARCKAISFKGPTLAETAYQSLACREFLDLDILVENARLDNVFAICMDAGYQPFFNLKDWQQRELCMGQGQLCFKHPSNQFLLEIHTSLSRKNTRYCRKLEDLWPHRRETVLVGSVIPSLPLDELFLYLCFHGTKHQWCRLGWACDLAGLMKRYDFDWDLLIHLAKTSGSFRALGLGLGLTHTLLGTPHPHDLSAQFRTNDSSHVLIDAVVVRLSGGQMGPMAPFQSTGFALRAADRKSDGLRMIAYRVCFPQLADWQAFKLPGALSFLYRLIRPIRLCAKYAKLAGRQVAATVLLHVRRQQA